MWWRAGVFLYVCLPVRALLAAGAAASSFPLRYAYAAFAGYVASGLWLQAAVVRPRRGVFGGVVWWGTARWAHAPLWSLACVLLLLPPVPAWAGASALAADVLLAAAAFVAWAPYGAA